MEEERGDPGFGKMSFNELSPKASFTCSLAPVVPADMGVGPHRCSTGTVLGLCEKKLWNQISEKC